MGLEIEIRMFLLGNSSLCYHFRSLLTINCHLKQPEKFCVLDALFAAQVLTKPGN